MTAKDPETGEDVPLPPPAESGAIVLDKVDKGVTMWLCAILISELTRAEHLIEATNANMTAQHLSD